MSDTDTAADAPARARRLTLSEVVERLLERGGSEHSAVTLARNAKGETQIEVVVRTGEHGTVSSVLEAEAVATQVYDRLRELYPPSSRSAGANGGTT